ncbi:hypothetical protein ACFYTQ_35440 [Nocardia sp. NPDC004068]|uniref:hypothetical protein n=1 Tax=Nocardia sp. NPDC004068 TaxID=3364303 RepID=UPI003688861B
MTKRYPPEVREKAVRLVLERLDEFESAYAAARATEDPPSSQPPTVINVTTHNS